MLRRQLQPLMLRRQLQPLRLRRQLRRLQPLMLRRQLQPLMLRRQLQPLRLRRQLQFRSTRIPCRRKKIRMSLTASEKVVGPRVSYQVAAKAAIVLWWGQ